MYSLYIPSVGLSEMQKAEARIAKLMGLRVVRLTPRGEAPQAALAGDHVKLTPRRAQTAQQRASEASELKHRAVGAGLMTMAEVGGVSPLVTMAREGTMEQKKNAAAALWSLALDANIRSAIAAYDTGRQLTARQLARQPDHHCPISRSTPSTADSANPVGLWRSSLRSLSSLRSPP